MGGHHHDWHDVPHCHRRAHCDAGYFSRGAALRPERLRARQRPRYVHKLCMGWAVKNNNTLPDGAVSRAIILAVAITVGGIFAMWVLFKVMKAVL